MCAAHLALAGARGRRGRRAARRAGAAGPPRGGAPARRRRGAVRDSLGAKTAVLPDPSANVDGEPRFVPQEFAREAKLLDALVDLLRAPERAGLDLATLRPEHARVHALAFKALTKLVTKNKRSDAYLRESGSIAGGGMEPSRGDGGERGARGESGEQGWLEAIDAQTQPLVELVSNHRNAVTDREGESLHWLDHAVRWDRATRIDGVRRG